MPTTYIRAGIGLAILALLAWGLRVDNLRARHLDALNSIRIVLKDSGLGDVKESFASQSVKLLATQRDLARSERDKAQAVVDIQSNSLKQMDVEAQEAARKAEANRRLIAATLAERDRWVKIAKSAETRTERNTAEQEASECDAVLNDLYNSGF